MGGNDEFHAGIVVDKPYQQLLVGFPRGPRDEQPVVGLEAVDDVDVLGCPGDLGDAVEARIAGHQHVVETERRQQFLRLLVLHEHHIERLEGLPPHAAVGAEEDRIAPEDGRHDIGADLAAAQFAQQVEPVFVFDEDCDFGAGGVEEPAGVARRVEGQVEDVVGALVVLADLIARGREEGDEDFVFGIVLANSFDDGTPLLELPE